MSNVYVKKDGVTSKVVEKCISSRLFRPNKIDAMDLFTGVDTSKTSHKLCMGVRKLLDVIKKDNYDIYKDLINKLVTMIINTKSIDDLSYNDESIIGTIISTYLYEKKLIDNSMRLSRLYEYDINTVKEFIKEESYIGSISSIIKDIMRRYVHVTIFSYDNEYIEKAYRGLINETNPLEYLSIDGIKCTDLKDEKLKYLLSNLIIPEINNKYTEGYMHLCFDCKTPICECPKIMDSFKKNIEEYDFIIDGKQITHEEKVLVREPDENMVMHEKITNAEITDEFIVTKCRKFKKSKGR